MEGLQSEGVKHPGHPAWYPPTGANSSGLHLLNSLTETVEPFVPRSGRLVKMYTCGPTVYDMSHMGHARCYLTFDIIRRVMEDYFGYPMLFQMNITDIDDKIIKRARVNQLMEDYVTGKPTVAQLTTDIDTALRAATATLGAKEAKLLLPLPADTPRRAVEEREEKRKELLLKQEQLAATGEAIREAQKQGGGDGEALLAVAGGVLSEWLDSETGSSVSDHSIFDAHSRRYEKEFFFDMQRLGIREPDVITRVTECVPAIVDFVQGIMDKGFAYVGESSIFFDTQAYIKAGHSYPKLLRRTAESTAMETTEEEMAEGEGALSKATKSEKRSPNDFALWKFSKPGEPRWPSPWGDGRPGWHIECSVMGTSVLGNNMDIHAGGCDLKFPHHDNEMAQSEAFHGIQQWVNYFMHCGHLHIKGLKMSKSLKNFVSIRQAFEELGVTAREMRLLFLANEWSKPMNFSDQSLGEAREADRVLRAFFGSVDSVLRGPYLDGRLGFGDAELTLHQSLAKAEEEVHRALCDNFSTHVALSVLMDLVSKVNQYMMMATAEPPSGTLLRKIAMYITKMLRIFGVVEGSDAIGFGERSSGDDKLVQVVDAATRFRDDVRKAARERQPPSVFLNLCDALRDDVLPPAGIRLEDKPDGSPSVWKLDDPQILMREMQEKKAGSAKGTKKGTPSTPMSR